MGLQRRTSTSGEDVTSSSTGQPFLGRPGIALAAVAAALALVVACQKAPTPTPTPTPIAAEAILLQAGVEMGRLSSFHFLLEHSQGGVVLPGGLVITTASGDVARPDKLRATLEGTVLGSFLRVNLVVVGDATYMTNPLTNAWQSFPLAVSPVAFFKPDEGIHALLGRVQGPRRLGDEVVGGRPAHHLEGTLPSDALAPLVGAALPGQSVTVGLWIDQERSLLLRAELVGRLLAEDSPGVKRTITLSAFNSPVDITAPQ